MRTPEQWETIRQAERVRNAKPVTFDSGGNSLHVGDMVYVKGYVAVAEARSRDATVVVFTDTKASHWSIEFHAEDINP
jgi:hypothetical protein